MLKGHQEAVFAYPTCVAGDPAGSIGAKPDFVWSMCQKRQENAIVVLRPETDKRAMALRCRKKGG
jgi:hypothetical protein